VPIPLHDQVAVEIGRVIAEGGASPGERLPLAKDLETPTAADEQNAQLLFREARRRRRRLRIIWIAIGTTVVVSLVTMGVAFPHFSSSSAPSSRVAAQPGWPPRLRTGATLVYALNDLRVLDADSGGSRVLPLPAPYGGSRDLAMVSVGHSFLLNRGNTAWLYHGSINSQPVDLGPSDGVFRGPTSNEAWIWSQPCAPIIGCTNYNAPQMGSVHLIDSSGRQIGSAVRLPGDVGWYPTGLAGNAGMVLSQLPPYGNHGNQQEIWNPLTHRVVHVFANGVVLGASGNTVVWELTAPYCETGCSLHVLNVRTGSQRTVRLPPGVTATGDTAISPDGSTIAITGALGATSHVPYPQAVLLIRSHTRVARVLAGSEQPTNPDLGPMALTWSTNGWLFSSTVGTTTVNAWRPGETQSRVLPKLRLPMVTQLVNEDPSLIAL
jgi:hypothetical protein